MSEQIPRDPQLSEKWNRLVEENERQGASPEQADVDLYFDIRERSDRDPDLKAAMDRLDKEIELYATALFRNQQEWLRLERGVGDKESVASSDRHRKTLHNTVIDRINQLSRMFRAKGLDNKWRNVLGLDRDRIAAWAMTVTRFILQKEEPAT